MSPILKTICKISFILIATSELSGIMYTWTNTDGIKIQAAKQKRTHLLNKNSVSLTQYGIEGYNRVLGEIFVNETNVNLEMVRAGLAEVCRGKPTDKYLP